MLVVILNLLSCSLSQSTSNSILDNSLGTLFNEIPRLIKKTYSTTTKPLDVILSKDKSRGKSNQFFSSHEKLYFKILVLLLL